MLFSNVLLREKRIEEEFFLEEKDEEGLNEIWKELKKIADEQLSILDPKQEKEKIDKELVVQDEYTTSQIKSPTLTKIEHNNNDYSTESNPNETNSGITTTIDLVWNNSSAQHLNHSQTIAFILYKSHELDFLHWGTVPLDITLSDAHTVLVTQSSWIQSSKPLALHLKTLSTLANNSASLGHLSLSRSFLIQTLQLLPYIPPLTSDRGIAISLTSLAIYISCHGLETLYHDVDSPPLYLANEALWLCALQIQKRNTDPNKDANYLKILNWESLMSKTTDECDEILRCYECILFGTPEIAPDGSKQKSRDKSFFIFRVTSVISSVLHAVLMLTNEYDFIYENSDAENRQTLRGNYLFFLLEKIKICEIETDKTLDKSQNNEHLYYLTLSLTFTALKLAVIHWGNLEEKLRRKPKISSKFSVFPSVNNTNNPANFSKNSSTSSRSSRRGKKSTTKAKKGVNTKKIGFQFFSESPNSFNGKDLTEIKKNLLSQYLHLRNLVLEMKFCYVGPLVVYTDRLMGQYMMSIREFSQMKQFIDILRRGSNNMKVCESMANVMELKMENEKQEDITKQELRKKRQEQHEQHEQQEQQEQQEQEAEEAEEAEKDEEQEQEQEQHEETIKVYDKSDDQDKTNYKKKNKKKDKKKEKQKKEVVLLMNNDKDNKKRKRKEEEEEQEEQEDNNNNNNNNNKVKNKENKEKIFIGYRKKRKAITVAGGAGAEKKTIGGLYGTCTWNWKK